MKYSLLKGLKKGVVGVIIFGIPLLIGNFPEYMELTVGGILLMILNFAKVKYHIKSI